MPSIEIEEFAKLLVQNLRDAAIQNCDRELQPNAASPNAKRWRNVAQGADNKTLQEVMIPDIVDNTVGQLLWAIDQGLIQISFTASNGKIVNLSKDGLGELCGWYMGSDGWRRVYSHERFVDDFSDLK